MNYNSARSDIVADEDENDFRKEMGDVKPLKSPNRYQADRSSEKKMSIAPRQRWLDDQDVVASLLDQDPLGSDVESGEEFLFTRDGIDGRTLRRLRRGDFKIEAELDLHGMIIDKARSALRMFIAQCGQEQIRCVRIIHGKGLRSPNKEPVLKFMTQRWLKNFDAVLAVCTAPANDGGTGAVYVLLKK